MTARSTTPAKATGLRATNRRRDRVDPLGPESLTWKYCGDLPASSNTPSCCANPRLPADAPLVGAPAFMAPPADRRGLPMHYLPNRKTLLDRAGSLVHTTFSLAGPRPAPGRGRAA